MACRWSLSRESECGICEDSETGLENRAIEGGCLVMQDKQELAAGYQNQDAEGYAEE